MGQAKQRGTFEERRDAAIHDNELIAKLLKENEEKWWNGLSESEQAKVRLARAKSAQAMVKTGDLSAAAHILGSVAF